MSNRTEQIDRDSKVLDEFEANLMSGLHFHRCAMSASSMTGYQPPSSRRSYAAALRILGTMANESDALANMAEALVRRLPVHALTPSETVYRLFAAADAKFNEGWFDTINAASPEPGRHSDNERLYGLKERIQVAVYLSHVRGAYLPGQGGIGWALEGLAKHHGVSTTVVA